MGAKAAGRLNTLAGRWEHARAVSLEVYEAALHLG